MPEHEDDRRTGDERPLTHERGVPLTFLPTRGVPFRWLPRHGDPLCVGEWLSQFAVKTLAWWPFYIAIIVTLILVIQITHPFGLGRL